MAAMQPAIIPASVAEPAVLTVKDVARMLNVSIDTLKAMQLGHELAYTQFADGRVRYSFADVLKFQALRSAAHKRLMDSYGERYAR